MPSIIEGSILIMSKAGTGTAMFSMGEIIYTNTNPPNLIVHFPLKRKLIFP